MFMIKNQSIDYSFVCSIFIFEALIMINDRLFCLRYFFAS